MDRPSPEDPRSAHSELARLVDTLLDGFGEQPADLPDAAAQLTGARSSASSADRLVEVTVDAYGIVLEVRLSPQAYQVSSPEQLGRSVTEAARSAALAAQRRRAEIVAPITGTGGDLPDLPDLFPGAPSLRGIRDIIESAGPGDSEPACARREHRSEG
ncbi:YbaB/EbfC family nucleoid-associated protein [Nocardia carnea]|uniref:YbaB/EbfC family nucleoid-associated protein n=1 Tax=Nocardia carnea TaxID=37328 RepID=UPI0024576277|nr:YbaB/EbfC family nucleoid-associated protein [Nocardia carnea]